MKLSKHKKVKLMAYEIYTKMDWQKRKLDLEITELARNLRGIRAAISAGGDERKMVAYEIIDRANRGVFAPRYCGISAFELETGEKKPSLDNLSEYEKLLNQEVAARYGLDVSQEIEECIGGLKELLYAAKIHLVGGSAKMNASYA